MPALLALLEAHRQVYPQEAGTVFTALRGAAIEAAGLIRACSRENGKEFAQRVADFIQDSYMRPDLSIADVCEQFSISQTQLALIFKREMDTSFLQYVLDLRIARAQELLLFSDKKIYQIAEEAGFEDAGYFSYCFKQRCGVTPKSFRQGGAHG